MCAYKKYMWFCTNYYINVNQDICISIFTRACYFWQHNIYQLVLWIIIKYIYFNLYLLWLIMYFVWNQHHKAWCPAFNKMSNQRDQSFKSQNVQRKNVNDLIIIKISVLELNGGVDVYNSVWILKCLFNT